MKLIQKLMVLSGVTCGRKLLICSLVVQQMQSNRRQEEEDQNLIFD